MSKPTAINSKISALNRFASYLIDSGQLSYNPVTRVQRVPVNPAEKDGRDDLAEDIQLLREVVYKHNVPRDIAIFELLYNTGISVSELCAIDVDDIILASTAGQLVIRHDQRGDRTLLPVSYTHLHRIRYAGYYGIRGKKRDFQQCGRYQGGSRCKQCLWSVRNRQACLLYTSSVSSALQPDPAEAVEPHSRILDGLSANEGGGKHIVYICESCGRMFFRVSKVTQCPFCEQEHIRPAAEQEKQQFNASAK